MRGATGRALLPGQHHLRTARGQQGAQLDRGEVLFGRIRGTAKGINTSAPTDETSTGGMPVWGLTRAWLGGCSVSWVSSLLRLLLIIYCN